MGDEIRDSYELIDKFMEEGEALVNVINSLTGFSPENPNPLTMRMTRFIKQTKEDRQ